MSSIRRYKRQRVEPRVVTTKEWCYTNTFDPELQDWSNDLWFISEAVRVHPFVLVSGPGGCGKSTSLKALRHLITVYTNLRCDVIAPTGVAGMNINGLTMHRWLGMGILKQAVDERFISTVTRNNIVNTDVLLIDEVSMIHPDFFAKFSQVCGICRGNSLPFGGIRIVMFGDFLQLPPVSINNVSTAKFITETPLWHQMNVFRIFLRHLYRQSDQYFMMILNKVRIGQVSERTLDYLSRRIIVSNNNVSYDVIRLMARTAHVDAFNQSMMCRLQEEPVQIRATVSCTSESRFHSTSENAKLAEIIHDPDKFFNFPSWVVLKNNARVMCRANITTDICNGSMGTIVNINSPYNISVKFDNIDDGPENIIPHQFRYNISDKACVSMCIIPLLPAWAISIHKCQSLSLSRAVVDAACFEEGQSYTALSRLRAVEGLHILGTRETIRNGIKTNVAAVRFERDPLMDILTLASRFCKTSALGVVWQRSNISYNRLFHYIITFL